MKNSNEIDFFNESSVNYIINNNYAIHSIINLDTKLHMKIEDIKSGEIFYRYTNLAGTDLSGSDKDQWDYQINIYN